MNKNLYVVEGKDDISKLSSLGLTYIISTSGYCLSSKVISFLKEANKVRKIVIVTDSDNPGKKIREKLHSFLKNYADVNLDKNKSVAHHKLGVAESDINHLKEKIDSYIREDELIKEEELSILDLFELNLEGPNSRTNKEKILNSLPLYKSNTKELLKQLNILKISKTQLEEIINGRFKKSH